MDQICRIGLEMSAGFFLLTIPGCFPGCSMLFDIDAGHTQFLEDVYECQSRMPGGRWDMATVPWTDVVCSCLVSTACIIPAVCSLDAVLQCLFVEK